MLEEVRMSYQDQLIDCIMWVLVSHPDLHYYQVSDFLLFILKLTENFLSSFDNLCLMLLGGAGGDGGSGH